MFDCCIGALVVWFVCFDLVGCGMLTGCDLGLFIVFILVCGWWRLWLVAFGIVYNVLIVLITFCAVVLIRSGAGVVVD